MLVKSTDLNDLAVSLANVLRNFDPNTMFWDSKSPTLFPNCDEQGFSIPQDIRKPFGVQRILESFAKSAGYKSYKGLLEDCSAIKSNKTKYFNVNINSLNPNPRNAYYTQYWEGFTSCIMHDIKSSLDNWNQGDQKGIIDHTLYQNIHIPTSIKYAPYMGWGVASICKYHLKFNKEIKLGAVGGVFNTTSDHYLSHYYPIAEAMVFSILERELVEVDSGWKYVKHYALENVPLSSFFKISKWHHNDLPLFLKSLKQAMHEYFFIDMRVTGQKGFENKMVHFHFKFDILERFKQAKAHFDIHQATKELLQIWVQNTEADHRLYIHPYLNQKYVMQNLDTYKDLGYYALNTYQGNKNSDTNFMCLSKQSWLNYCLKFPFHLLDLENFNSDHFKSKTDKFFSELFVVEVVESACDYKFNYHFSLSNFDYLCRNDQETAFLPHRVTVRSEYELASPFAELAVQAEVIKLLPSNINCDYYTKLIGDASQIAFENNNGEILDPIFHIKKIGNLKNPDLVIDFDFKNIIHQITIDPFVNDLKYGSIYDVDRVLDPITNEPIAFERMFNHIDTTLFFNMNVTLVDTVLPMDEFHSTSDGFNNLELYVEYDLKDKSIDVLDINYLGKLSKKVRNQYIKILEFLIDHPQFNHLVFYALNYVKATYIKKLNSQMQLLDIMTIDLSHEDLPFVYSQSGDVVSE